MGKGKGGGTPVGPGLLNVQTGRGAPTRPAPMVYPENARPMHGMNLISQLLAAGQSPQVGNYYAPSDFRQANGQMGNMAQYAPRSVMTQVGRTDQFPHDWARQGDAFLRERMGLPPLTGPGGVGGGTGGGNPTGGGTPPPTGAPTASQAWQNSLTPEQRALLGGAQGNHDFRATLTPEQMQLRQAAIAARNGQGAAPPPAAPPGYPQLGPTTNLQRGPMGAPLQPGPQGQMWNPATQPQGQPDREFRAQQQAMAQQRAAAGQPDWRATLGQPMGGAGQPMPAAGSPSGFIGSAVGQLRPPQQPPGTGGYLGQLLQQQAQQAGKLPFQPGSQPLFNNMTGSNPYAGMSQPPPGGYPMLTADQRRAAAGIDGSGRTTMPGFNGPTWQQQGIQYNSQPGAQGGGLMQMLGLLRNLGMGG